MTPQNGNYGDYCRLAAKIIIQIINTILKDEKGNDSDTRDFYLATQCFHDLGWFTEQSLVNKYPWDYVKKIVTQHVESNQYWPCVTYAELVSLFPCEVVSNDDILNTICEKILADNPKSIIDFKKGKLNALNHLKGQVMRESKGKADIQKVEAILKERML